MPKFFVHKTHSVSITEIFTVESVDEDSAVDELLFNSGGNYLGVVVGDNVSFIDDEQHEVFTATDENIPANLMVFKNPVF